VTRVKDGKKVDPNAPKEKEVDEAQGGHSYGQGVYEAKKKGDGNLANNAKPYDKVTRGDVIAGRLGKDEKGGKKVEESSTGDYSAKKAAAGKDIGKPGKNFSKIEKSAGGGEKGKKIAGAVLAKLRGKNESYVAQAVAEAKKGKKPDYADLDNDGDEKELMKDAAIQAKKETVKESSELNRMRELAGRLNLNENFIVKESNEVDQLRALTKRLLG
jgi:hypothetical protein